MKKIIIIFIILLPFCSFSQIKINGIIKDDIGMITNANIVIAKNNKEIVKELTTNNAGYFECIIPKGTYVFTINHVDYEPHIAEHIIKENVVLNTITLERKVNVLGEVVIKSSTNLIKRKLDKTIFSVQKSPIASIGNGFDALKRTPGLILKNDEIAMLGKSGVKIMVEGKMVQLTGEDLKNFLKTISATDIKEIEIISNPSSKYEAEGNSGIVNIIFKRSKKNSWSNTIATTHTQAKFGKQSINNNFSYRKDKINLSLITGLDYGNTHRDQRVEIDFKEDPLKLKTIQKVNDNNFSTRFLFDYDLNENNKIGVQYAAVFSKSNINDNIKTSIFNNSNEINHYLFAKGDLNGNKKNHSFNLFYETKLDTTGKKITFNLDFLNFANDLESYLLSKKYNSNSEFLNIDFSNNSNINQNINNYNAKIDVEHPSEFANFQYGTKISFINTKNNNIYFDLITGAPVYDPTLSDNFNYQENIQAIYGTATKKISPKVEIQFGLRTEYTQTIGESKKLDQIDKNDYLKLFPTLFLSYKKNDENIYIFNYGRRIQRPDYSALNPLRYFVNSNISSQGNPNLKPAYIDNFELTHTYKDNLSTKLSFTKKTNAFGVVFNLNPETQEQLIGPENFFTNYSFALTENYQLPLFSWWKTDNTLFLNYSISDKTNNDIKATVKNGLEFYGSINNLFTLDKEGKILGEINFWYNSAYNDNIYKYLQASSVDIAFTYKSIYKDLNLSAGVFDIFNSSPRKMISEVNGIQQNYIAYSSNRYFKISLNYMLGNNKVKAPKRNFGNEEERNRSN
ncbi:TonB-dependent receptor [Flavobacterium branchiarum]|uniref:Outer membrane beta-barrel protein n=1 Tax=Flavobacterium branchiarum TaxID=1114870 RepID=A0ABV5FQV0_9FLAO|nr:outer membrane beta-barrel protein [Flavobacterium branchiarum]MDN3673268.1 TonB-dependent receptor [Flavobacterium branchiarum]